MNSWNGHQRPPARTCVRTGSSVAGSTRARHAERAPRLVDRLGQPRALREPPRAPQAQREVAVAEVEPHVLAELAQPVHHVEGVAAQAPAALVDAVGEPERHEVRVGGDVAAVDLDVVARVGDHDEVLADLVEHPARELGAAGAARQDYHSCRASRGPP